MSRMKKFISAVLGILMIVSAGMPQMAYADDAGSAPQEIQTKDVFGSVDWSDDNNKAGKRPDSVTIHLLADGKDTGKTALVSKNDSDFTFKDVPEKDGDRTIAYSVKENDIPDYEISYTAASSYSNKKGEGVKTSFSFGITNTYKPAPVEKVSTSVKVVWDDANNQDGKRPDKVNVQLIAEPGDVNMALDSSNNWSSSFEGTKGNRSIIAGDEVKDYTCTVSGDDSTGYTVTYKHEPEKAKIDAGINWNDQNNADGSRPDEIKADILADNVKVSEVILSKANSWKASINDLPKYKNGKEIVYRLSASNLPNYTQAAAPGGYTITYTRSVEKKTEASVEISWNDSGSTKRPASVMVQLYADGQKEGDPVKLSSDGAWKHIFTNLQAEKKDGTQIKYTIDETAVPAGYTKKIAANGTKTTITNTYAQPNPEGNKVSVKGKITWNDQNDVDKIRPNKVTVTLLANGKEIDKKDVSSTDGWTFDFGERDKTGSDGKAITYTVRESSIVGYSAAVSGYDITNTHTSNSVKTGNQNQQPGNNSVSSNTTTVTPAQTGDAANLVLWVVIAAAAGCGIVIVLKKQKKSEKK